MHVFIELLQLLEALIMMRTVRVKHVFGLYLSGVPADALVYARLNSRQITRAIS